MVSQAERPPFRLDTNQEVSIGNDIRPKKVKLFEQISDDHRGDQNATDPYFVILTRAVQAEEKQELLVIAPSLDSTLIDSNGLTEEEARFLVRSSLIKGD